MMSCHQTTQDTLCQLHVPPKHYLTIFEPKTSEKQSKLKQKDSAMHSNERLGRECQSVWEWLNGLWLANHDCREDLAIDQLSNLLWNITICEHFNTKN